MAQKRNRAIPGPRKNAKVEKNTPMKKAVRVLTSLGRGVKSVSREAAHVGREVAAAGGRAWSDYSDWARAQNVKAAEHNLAMTELRMKKRNILDEMPEMVGGDEGGGPGWGGADGQGRFPLPERRMPDRRFVPATPVGYPTFHEAPAMQAHPQGGQTITVNVGTGQGSRGLPPREESIHIPMAGEVPMEMAPGQGFERDEREFGREPISEEPQFPQGFQRARPMIRRGPIARYHPLDQTGILGSTGILQTRGFLGQTGALNSGRTGGTGRLLMSTGMLRATGAYQRRTYRPPQTIGVESLGPLPEPLPEERARPTPPPRRPGQVPGRRQR